MVFSMFSNIAHFKQKYSIGHFSQLVHLYSDTFLVNLSALSFRYNYRIQGHSRVRVRVGVRVRAVAECGPVFYSYSFKFTKINSCANGSYLLKNLTLNLENAYLS